jgi:hypothetical protein
MQHVVDGTVSISSDSDGGSSGDSIGLRPIWRDKSGRRGVVFVGSPGTPDTRKQSSSRLQLLRKLIESGVDVEVFGPEEEWMSQGFESSGVINGAELCSVYMTSAAVLAMSRDVQSSASASAAAVGMYRLVTHYILHPALHTPNLKCPASRSDRTLCITGCGGVIVSECFRGYQEMFGDTSARCANSAEEFHEIIEGILSSQSSKSPALESLEAVTWSFYTWEDAIDVVFTTLENKVIDRGDDEDD